MAISNGGKCQGGKCLGGIWILEAKDGWEKSWEAIVVLAANVQNGKRVSGLCQSGIWRAANISDPAWLII